MQPPEPPDGAIHYKQFAAQFAPLFGLKIFCFLPACQQIEPIALVAAPFKQMVIAVCVIMQHGGHVHSWDILRKQPPKHPGHAVEVANEIGPNGYHRPHVAER